MNVSDNDINVLAAQILTSGSMAKMVVGGSDSDGGLLMTACSSQPCADPDVHPSASRRRLLFHLFHHLKI